MKTELTLKKGSLELENFLDDELKNLLAATKTVAANHGLRNQPPDTEPSLVPVFLGKQISQLQLIINKVREKLGVEYFIQRYHLLAKELQDKLPRLTIERNKIANQLLDSSQEMEKYKHYSTRTILFSFLPLAAILLIETLGMYSAYSAVIPSTGMRILAATASGLFLGIIAHLVVHVFMVGSKWLRITVIALIFILLWVTGVFRAYAMELQSQSIMDNTAINPFSGKTIRNGLIFAFASAALLSAGIYIAFLTRDKLAQIIHYISVRKNHKLLTSKLKNKQQEIEDEQRKVDEAKLSAWTAFTDAAHAEKTIMSWLPVIQSEYAHENIMKRTDDKRPTCLSEKIIYSFHTFYQNPTQIFNTEVVYE